MITSSTNLVSEIRSFCEKEYDRIQERHRFGVSSREIVAEYTRLADNVIFRIVRHAEQTGVLPLEFPMAILAVGGYGREELNRHSDIDIMLVYDSSVDLGQLEEFSSILVTVLWDTGFEVGHSCRSVRECVKVTQEDLFSKTSMLEARFVIGKENVYRHYLRVTSKPLFKRQVGRFISQKIQDWNNRHEAYGSTIYLQEPNLKESVGGLRDFHTAIWISTVQYGSKSIEDLQRKQLIPSTVYLPTISAVDFMLRVRNELHLLSKRCNDILSFEMQESTAKNLGYKDKSNSFSEEQLLQDYFLHAENIFEFAKLIIDRASYGYPSLSIIFDVFRRQKLADGFRIVRNEIVFEKGKADFNQETERIFKLFMHRQQTNCRVSAEVRYSLANSLDQIDDQFRCSSKIAGYFLSILAEPNNVARTLRRMHRWKILEAYLPEFSHLRAQFQLDGFHQYTVDEHTFYAIENLETNTLVEVKGGQVFIDLLNELEHPELLRLSVLLHDIGKGLKNEGNHDQKSVELSKIILERLGITGAKSQLVLFLIEQHLTMSYISRHRDLDDEKVIQSFADIFTGDTNKLKMLYLLTYADIRAVNSVVWNDWHATLLWQLYERTLTIMQNYNKKIGLSELEQSVDKQLSYQVPIEKIRTHFEQMETLASHHPVAIANQIELVEQYTELRDVLSVVLVCLEQGEQHTRIGICTQDSIGLFRRIAGILTAENINILSADLETRKDNIVVDLLTISEIDPKSKQHLAVSTQRCAELAKIFNQIWSKESDVNKLLDKAESKPLPISERNKPGLHQTSIQINNEESDQCTILEIRTRDRVGLLFTITDVLLGLGLDLRIAKIFTQPTFVIDTFYVTESDGSKIQDGVRIEQIRQILEEKI